MAESPSGTYITTANAIIDSNGNVWTLTSSPQMGMQVVCNGKVDTATQQVIKLGYYNGRIYQENVGHYWYVKDPTPTASWSQTSDPEGTIATPPVTNPPVTNPPVSTVGVQALSADGFVDSIGVNTRFMNPTSNWTKNLTSIKNLLLSAGIRNCREAMVPGSSNISTLQGLNSSGGIRFGILTGPNQSTAAQVPSFITSLGSKAVRMVEGINEPDLGNYDVTKTTSWQKSIYQAVKANSSLANIPVIGPSLINSNSISASGGMVQYMDGTNCHPYQSGREPESVGWGNDGYGSLPWVLKYFASLKPNSPVYFTECGYNSTPTSTPGVATTEAVEAIYMPRFFMNSYVQNVVCCYKYDFVNELGQDVGNDVGQQNYGLVHADMSPKAAYNAIKNLISLCKDPGPSFTVGKLDYTLSGNTNKINTMLLGKRDGSFILGLVNISSIYDASSQKNLTPPAPQSVTVHVNGKTKVATAKPNQSGSWTPGTLSSGSITVSVNESLLLLQFS